MNKNSKVLALKYRPSNFDDLIGQDVVAETILNSIKENLKEISTKHHAKNFISNLND